MSEWFANGRIIDVIVLAMMVEGIVLAAVQARTGRGLGTRPLLTTLASGAALMLAVRAALVGAGWAVVSVCLLAGLVAHLVDLASRWR